MADDAQVTPRGVGQLLKANTTLMVWLVFLALGGGILALYYARINYLPDIEWSSSIVYLAVASFIGGGVGLLFALSLLLPGLIWAESLLCDPGLVKVFYYKSGRGKELCLRTILRYLGVPFGVVLLISHIALRTDLIRSSAKIEVAVYSAITVVLLVRTFFVMRLIFKRLLARGGVELSKIGTFEYSIFVIRLILIPKLSALKLFLRNLRRRRRSVSKESARPIFKYSSWFTLSVFLSQISMLVVYRLSGRPSGLNFLILTLICTAGVLISNLVVAVRYHHNPRQAMAAPLVAATVLIFVANEFSSLSQGIMASYGFGDRHKVNLLLTEKGATIIENLGLPECIPPTPRVLCDVEILSKIGEEYCLKVGGRTFTLPKVAVQSYISEQSAANQDVPKMQSREKEPGPLSSQNIKSN